MGSISAVRRPQRLAWRPGGLITTLARRLSAAPRGCIRASVRPLSLAGASAPPQSSSLSTVVSCSPFQYAADVTDAATCLVQALFFASPELQSRGFGSRSTGRLQVFLHSAQASGNDTSAACRPELAVCETLASPASKLCRRLRPSCTPSLRNYTQKESRKTCDQPRIEDPIYYCADAKTTMLS